MIASLKCTLVALLISLSSLVYATDHQNQDILNAICDHAQAAIEGVEGDKVFLRPENVCLYNGKIYVAGDRSGEAVRIPHLFSDENGLYLAKDKKTTIYICRSCTKAYYNYKPDRCEQCLGTDFLVRFQ